MSCCHGASGKGGQTGRLHQIDLSHRWKISHRTLERWRWAGTGPRYVKVGGRVLYRLEDVEAYEADGIRETEARTSAPASDPAQHGVAPGRHLPRK